MEYRELTEKIIGCAYEKEIVGGFVTDAVRNYLVNLVILSKNSWTIAKPLYSQLTTS